MRERKVIILGSGPAGLTAAIYAARSELEPLVIAGSEPGGQLMLTTEVENYPGFPEGVIGPELMAKMRKQAERFGAEFVNGNVTAVDFNNHPFKVTVEATEYICQSVIITTGASSKWLGLPRENELIGHGISSCATCDGFFFKDKKVAVIGGGDSAMEESTFLTKFASSVTVVHRRDQLRASKIMQERAKNNPKITFLYDHVVEEILGDDALTSLKLKNVKTGEINKHKFDGMFVAIGHKPNTDIFSAPSPSGKLGGSASGGKGQIELDQKGYIVVNDHTKTSVEGVFVGGDVHDYHYRQAVTAAGFGCMAAMDADKWLNGA